MGLQNWRWWQWVAVSILVGVGVGFAFTRLDADDPSLPSTAFSMMRSKIGRTTESGESILTAIRVGPVVTDVSGKRMQPVTYWERQHNRVTGKWDPTQQYRTATPVPLSPQSPRPDFGVIDFLAATKKDIPTLDYKFQWWLVPKNVWLLSMVGSVLGIGVLWPLTLKVLIKLGLAEPPTERAGETTRVRHDEETAVGTRQGVTVDDAQKLADLNAELEANVAGMSIGGAPPAAAEAERPAAPGGVRVLGAERPAQPSLPSVDPTPDDFKGEFYPVARPITHTPPTPQPTKHSE